MQSGTAETVGLEILKFCWVANFSQYDIPTDILDQQEQYEVGNRSELES